MFRKFLKRIWVIQEKTVYIKNNPLFENRTIRHRRINPYNPLTYLIVLITLIIGILLFGFVGVWKETNLKNDFKWNQ
jgi:hypothetical protein